MTSLKIGILGTRGIPNQYGGFEEFAEQLSTGLIHMGHTVTVYCSKQHTYQQKEWKGVSLVHCYDPEKTIGTAGQFVYDLNCFLDARKKDFDILLILGYTSSSVWHRYYPKKAIVISNMDGMEWKRTKYSLPVRQFLGYAEKLAVLWSHFHIADNPEIKRYLDIKYGISSKYIAYGADILAHPDAELPERFGLVKGEYYMVMARMERENNIEMILDGIHGSNTVYTCIVIGNTLNAFGKKLEQKYAADKRIRFLGPIFERAVIKNLMHHAALYFHGHSVGGTNPSLLEAMASGSCIAAHKNLFNRAVLQENALYFESVDQVKDMVEEKAYLLSVEVFKQNNLTVIKDQFTWDKIITSYGNFFQECYHSRFGNQGKLQ